MATATPWNPQKAVGLHFNNGKLTSLPSVGTGGRFSFSPQPWNGPVNNNGLRVIGGYQNSGIQTDKFQQQFGRAPTAADYERRFGGLSPEHDQIGSLDDFYAMNRADPLTGLAYKPSAFDRLQNSRINQQGGDFEQNAANKAYWNTVGDPQAHAAAAQNLQNLGNSRRFLQSITPQAQTGGGAVQSPWEIHATNDIMPEPAMPPFPTGPSVAGGVNYNTGEMSGLAKGGRAGMARPYITGEKGNELFTGADGQQKMLGMNGPEMDVFTEPGFVTPHNKLPPRLQLTRGNGNPTIPQMMGVPNRWVGGPVSGSPIVSLPEYPSGAKLLDNEGDMPVAEPAFSTMADSIAQGVAALPFQQAATQARMAPLGATALSPVASPVQSFGTPYGTASVSSVPHGTKEATVEGLPISEWFARAANRQGEANKYASPEEGYVKPAQDYRQRLLHADRMRQVAKEAKGLKFS